MVRAVILIEGGGESREAKIRLREGFRKLFSKIGLSGRMPQTVACGGRSNAYDLFCTKHANAKANEYVALLVDSEDPINDIEATWQHVKDRPGDEWDKPIGADDEQLLLMTTCTETWLATDRQALRQFFGSCLNENKLPALVEMESRPRQSMLQGLRDATTACGKKQYAKGDLSFEVLAVVNPNTLRPHLPSFARVERILKAKL